MRNPLYMLLNYLLNNDIVYIFIGIRQMIETTLWQNLATFQWTFSIGSKSFIVTSCNSLRIHFVTSQSLNIITEIPRRLVHVKKILTKENTLVYNIWLNFMNLYFRPVKACYTGMVNAIIPTYCRHIFKGQSHVFGQKLFFHF